MNIILLLGTASLLIGAVWLLIEAFKTSMLWGFGCLLLNPVSLVFIFLHWDRAKVPFILEVIGIAIILTHKFS